MFSTINWGTMRLFVELLLFAVINVTILRYFLGNLRNFFRNSRNLLRNLCYFYESCATIHLLVFFLMTCVGTCVIFRILALLFVISRHFLGNLRHFSETGVTFLSSCVITYLLVLFLWTLTTFSASCAKPYPPKNNFHQLFK